MGIEPQCRGITNPTTRSQRGVPPGVAGHGNGRSTWSMSPSSPRRSIRLIDLRRSPDCSPGADEEGCPPAAWAQDQIDLQGELEPEQAVAGWGRGLGGTSWTESAPCSLHVLVALLAWNNRRSPNSLLENTSNMPRSVFVQLKTGQMQLEANTRHRGHVPSWPSRKRPLLSMAAHLVQREGGNCCRAIACEHDVQPC